MIQLIYTSSATRHITTHDLMEIAAVARAHNRRDGITGMLLFKDGCFMQLLEGDEEKVQACHARISRDPRHRWIVQLMTAPLEVREFPDWAMGVQDISVLTVEQKRQLEPYLDHGFDSTAFVKNPTFAQRMLREFKAARFWRGPVE